MSFEEANRKVNISIGLLIAIGVSVFTGTTIYVEQAHTNEKVNHLEKYQYELKVSINERIDKKTIRNYREIEELKDYISKLESRIRALECDVNWE